MFGWPRGGCPKDSPASAGSTSWWPPTLRNPAKSWSASKPTAACGSTALIAAGYQVYAVNPLAVARYRDRHHVSGAKSDAGDAKLLADLVRTDRHNHRMIAGDSPTAEAIKVLARGHQNLIWTRTRHTNALRNALA